MPACEHLCVHDDDLSVLELHIICTYEHIQRSHQSVTLTGHVPARHQDANKKELFCFGILGRIPWLTPRFRGGLFPRDFNGFLGKYRS